MIRKFLVCTKQLFLSSTPLEEPGGAEKIPNVELLLPLEAFWELQDRLKKIDYMTASSEDPALVIEQVHKVFRTVLKYVVYEKDRNYLNERLRGNDPKPP